MKKLLNILVVALFLVSCTKEDLPADLKGEWLNYEAPYQKLEFSNNTVKIQRADSEPVLCAYDYIDEVVETIEDGEMPARFAKVEALTETELSLRFLNTSVEVRLDTTVVYHFRKGGE